MLQERGHRVQTVICGPVTFGKYRKVCQDIANQMEIPTIFTGFVSSELHQAIMQCSHCVVYPSIHGKPFGMVPVEAMASGTPVIVPDNGGVSELTGLDSLRGGLNFRSWDSGDLANQIERLLTDSELYDALTRDTQQIAGHHSIERMADQTLEHLGVTS